MMFYGVGHSGVNHMSKLCRQLLFARDVSNAAPGPGCAYRCHRVGKDNSTTSPPSGAFCASAAPPCSAIIRAATDFDRNATGFSHDRLDALVWALTDLSEAAETRQFCFVRV
jgi:hypothetical protein